MLEAARLIETLGVKPRRTVRVALWSGEEEGLLGSLAYVKQHFGTAEQAKTEWARLNACFNVDTGTGRLRGAAGAGPPRQQRGCVRCSLSSRIGEWREPLRLAAALRAARDSTSFGWTPGLPGIGMSQDPIKYGSLTHHTNLDTYERGIPDDVQKAAATITKQAANGDAIVKKSSKEAMPAAVVRARSLRHKSR